MELPSRTVLFVSKATDLKKVAPVPAAAHGALDRHPAAVYLASLSPGSRRTMRGALRTIAEIVTAKADEVAMPWQRLDFAHATAIRTRLAEKYAPATSNRMLASMKGVIKTAFKLGLISAEQMSRATSIEPVRGFRLPRGRSISPGELRSLFGICDPKKAVGARDAALLGLLYAAGLRRAEVVALDVDHLEVTSGAVVVRGKGNKERRVYVSKGALDAARAWLGHRGDEPGPLLTPVAKGGRIELRRMTDQAVAERVRHLATKAGVSTLSPHDFRKSFVGDLLDAGADLATVQQIAGHASPATTSKYDRRGDRAKKRAADLLHVPFVGR
jgi:site-specific recombinase XerD